MSLVNLNIHPRTACGKNENRRTRAAGRVPAVLYGKGRTTIMIELDNHDFELALKHLGGRSAIFQLHQEGMEEGHIALLREVQRHPVRDQILHVDLLEVPKGQPVGGNQLPAARPARVRGARRHRSAAERQDLRP